MSHWEDIFPMLRSIWWFLLQFLLWNKTLFRSFKILILKHINYKWSMVTSVITYALQFFTINMFLCSNCKTQSERKQRQNAFISKWVHYIKCIHSGGEVSWFQISRSSEIDCFQYNLLETYCHSMTDGLIIKNHLTPPARPFLLKRKKELWRKDNFLQFIKGLYNEFTFTWEMWLRTLEVLRYLKGNYMILWIWVSVTIVTGTMVNDHTYIGLISSRVAFQVLCFCLEITLDEDVNLKSPQSAFKIQRTYINLFISTVFYMVWVSQQIRQILNSSLYFTLLWGKSHKSEAWKTAGHQLFAICFSCNVMSHFSSIALILLPRKRIEAFYTKLQKLP